MMTPGAIGLVLLVAAMAVESAAQVCLKVAAADGTMAPKFGEMVLRLPTRGWIALGVAAYGVEILLYTATLHFLDVSVAFPLGSLCFVGVALLSKWLLGETVSRVRCLGIGFILAGTVLVAL